MKKIIAILCAVLMVLPVVMGSIIDSPSIEASIAYQEPDPVEPGDEVELRFSVKNTGSSTAKSTELAIVTEYPFSLSPGEDDAVEIGDVKIYDATEIDTGEASAKFKLVVDEDALEGDYDLIIKYKTEEGISRGEWIELDPFTVSVGSKGTYLVLKESATTPETVSPGEQGELTLTFSNEGNTALEDITVTVDLDDVSEISPLRTGTELVINQLNPGEQEEVVFSFIIAPDAVIKVYKLPLEITYQDARGDDYDKSIYTSIVAGAEPEYILNLEDSEVYKKKQSGNIVISLSNIGVANINYATLTLKENEYYTILSPDAVYLGNLESDDFETAQFTIYTDEYSEAVPLELTLFYKDDYNQNYEEDITLEMKLFTSGEAKQYGLVEGGSSWFFIVIVLIGGGVWYWYKYKRKPKKK